MESPVKITAEVLQHDRASCKFTVDRPIFKEGSIRFRDAAQAAPSPLAQRLFAVEGVQSVLIQGQEIIVSKKAPVDWRVTGPLIGAAIRAHLASGVAAVNPDSLKNLPAEDLLRQKVQHIIDDQINPAVASHGGYITLVDVQGTNLLIRMGGGCQGCGMANATLRDGIEEALRAQVPELGEIIDVTDHTSGETPYYASSGH